MKLFTKQQREELLRNGEVQQKAKMKGECIDLKPVVKLFTPDGNCTWLLTMLYPDDSDIAYGLCDLGMGLPELGDVRISDLESPRGPLGLPVERDLYFQAKKTIGGYAREAHEARCIRA